LDLIVIHTPKTVSLKNSVACWTARRQVAREEIAPIAEPPKQFTQSFTQNVRRQRTIRRRRLYLARRLMQTLPHEASGTSDRVLSQRRPRSGEKAPPQAFAASELL